MPRVLLLDTNVIIDALAPGRPEGAAARSLIAEALGRDDVELAVLASSLKDFYFIYERHYGSEPEARRQVRLLRTLATLVDLTGGVVDRALGSDEPDFEDGLVRAAAEGIGADLIVSRDAAAFAGSPVSRTDAAGALEWLRASR